MDTDQAPASRDWKAENRMGLELVTSGNWAGAIAAFERAIACLDDGPSVSARWRNDMDETRAVLYSNMSQAYLHCRRGDEAQRYAEKTVSLRVALFGEHAVTVAVARNNLAVVLCMRGRSHDALSLLERAIISIDLPAAASPAQIQQLRDNAARIEKFAEQTTADAFESASVMDALPEIASAFDHSFETDRSESAGFDLAEPPPPTLNELPEAAPSATRANPLGFDVEYGIPREHHEPLNHQPVRPPD